MQLQDLTANVVFVPMIATSCLDNQYEKYGDVDCEIELVDTFNQISLKRKFHMLDTFQYKINQTQHNMEVELNPICRIHPRKTVV